MLVRLQGYMTHVRLLIVFFLSLLGSGKILSKQSQTTTKTLFQKLPRDIKMNPNLRIFLGLSLVFVGFFWNDIQERIPDFVSDKVTIDIEEPSEDIKLKTSFSRVITDRKHKIKLTCFNKAFSDRCIDYEATNQDVNDIYTLAAKEFFGDSLNGKYNGYGDNLVKIMKDAIGEEVHRLSEEEKNKLSQTFLGLAWQTSN